MKPARSLLIGLSVVTAIALVVSVSGCTTTTAPYAASGRITDGNGAGITEVSVLVDGVGVAATDDDGEWSLADVQGRRTVIPTKTGWEFTPPCATISANQPEADFVGEAATYTIDVVVGGQGAVERNPDQAGYMHQDTVALTAVPSTGWEFSHWKGDLSGDTNPSIVQMDADKTVQAVFERIPLTVYDDFSGDTLDESLWVPSVAEGGSIRLGEGRAAFETPSQIILTSITPLSGKYFAVSGELNLVDNGFAYMGFSAGSNYVRMCVNTGGAVRGERNVGGQYLRFFNQAGAAKPTEVNELVMRREGDTFSLYLNDVLVTEETVDGFPTDDVKFFVMAFRSSGESAVNIWNQVSYGQFD